MQFAWNEPWLALFSKYSLRTEINKTWEESGDQRMKPQSVLFVEQNNLFDDIYLSNSLALCSF